MYSAKNISSIGRIFIQKVLEVNYGIRNDLMTDWKKSLEFFLFHAFMRGRSDELSIAYKDNAIKLLRSYLDQPIDKIRKDVNGLTFEINKFKKSQYKKLSSNALSDKLFFPTFQNNDFIQLFNIQKPNSTKYLVGNDKDIIMVAEVIKLIFDERIIPTNYQLNIYAYTVDSLRNGEIEALYNKLIGVKFIGDKLASFYLRNVVKLEGLSFLEDTLEDYLPIDRWIENICIRLGVFEKADKKKIRKNLMKEYCLKNEVNQVEFNQGAWLVGFASFPILMEILEKKEILDIINLNGIEVFDYISK